MQQQNQGFIQEVEAPATSYPNRKFILQKSLGQGAQGSVFLVKSKNWGIHDQNDFALKQTFLNNVGDNEIKFIESIIQYQNSQNEAIYPCGVIRVFDNFIYNNLCNITVMEKGDIDLYQFLNQNRDKLTYEDKLQICIDITRPIHFLHQNQLVHRDIKPENYIKAGNVFKLIDFGLVRKSTFIRLKTIGVGTPLFQAPEIVDNKQNYSQKVDVWALTCVFYEIFNQKALFDYNDAQTLRQKILNHIDDQSEVNQKISSLNCNLELKNLMKAMLHPKEDERLSSEEVLDRLVNIKNQPKKIIPFPFQNKFNFQQEPKLNGNKSEQTLFQQLPNGGRFQTISQSNINPYQFKQIEQKQFQNQFPNLQTQFDEKIEKLEIKLKEVMKNQMQIKNNEILEKINQQEEKQKQYSVQIAENLQKFFKFQTIQEVSNKQFQTNMNKLNEQYSNIEKIINKIVNEKIENNNRQIQLQEQNILQKIQQQYNKEIEQLKLENNKRVQDVQKIESQFQNELNNKQLIIKQLQQQEEFNKQNKSIETQKILDNIAEIKKSQDTKISQLENTQKQIQQQFNQSLQNYTFQVNNQMTSILEQYRKSQYIEIEAIKQQIQIINENFVKLKNEMELKISQFAEQTQKDINQTVKQTHNNLNQYKENTYNNFEQLKKELQQEFTKITKTNDQKFYQFKQDIERLNIILDEQKQILQTQVENNKIFNPFQMDNIQNASPIQKEVYMNYNQILEKLSKTHQEIWFLNQQIIGLEQFIYGDKRQQ